MERMLSKKIAAFKEKGEKQIIVAVCGAADLGKSCLSKKIAQNLNSTGIPTYHLTLDSFLMGRAQRLEQNISGYDIRAYDQASVLAALNNFKKNQPVVFAPYIHSIGKCTETYVTLDPCAILLFDGVQSMHDLFLPYIDYSIFIYTADDTLKKIRYEADLRKRHYSPEFAKSNSESEFNYYKSHILPYRQQADLVLFLQKKWNYILSPSFFKKLQG